MEISNELLDGILKINLIGRMDVEGVAAISDPFASMLEQDKLSVIVDMTEVPYMSSIGIRALLINAKQVSRRGGKYVLLGPQPDVKNVLQVSGIDKIIGVCDTLDEAKNKVKPN